MFVFVGMVFKFLGYYVLVSSFKLRNYNWNMVDVFSNLGIFVEYGYRVFVGSLFNLKKFSEKCRVDEF